MNAADAASALVPYAAQRPTRSMALVLLLCVALVVVAGVVALVLLRRDGEDR